MIKKFPEIKFTEYSLIPWIVKTSKMLGVFMKSNFSEYGFDLTREQVILLAHLHLEDGQMQKDLAFITERNKGSLARLVNTMEKKNFVVRIPSREDKRVNRIFLTKKGRQIFEKIRPVLHECKTAALKNLTQKEIDSTIKVLQKIQNNISK